MVTKQTFFERKLNVTTQVLTSMNIHNTWLDAYRSTIGTLRTQSRHFVLISQRQHCAVCSINVSRLNSNLQPQVVEEPSDIANGTEDTAKCV